MSTIEPYFYDIHDLPKGVANKVLSDLAEDWYNYFEEVILKEYKNECYKLGIILHEWKPNLNSSFKLTLRLSPEEVIENIRNTFIPGDSLYDVVVNGWDNGLYYSPKNEYISLMLDLKWIYGNLITEDYLEFTSPRSIVNTIKEENLMFTFNGEMYV